MSVKAVARGVRMSPRKLSVVASLVRGRTVSEAVTILEHTPRQAALPIKKVIESAKANADYNHGYKPDTLRIVEISVTPGPRLKRFRAAARGAALAYQRRSAHVLVAVDGEKREVKKPVAKKAETNKETK